MKRSRFSEERIIGILKEAGAAGKDICRRHGISEQTFYRWKAKFGGLGVSDARRLKQLATENAKPKKLVADLTLDKEVLKELLEKTSEARGASQGLCPSGGDEGHEPAPGLRAGRTASVGGALLPSAG